MRARVTRIDYESEDGERAASLQRVDSPHVPPLGVTWCLERFEHGRRVAQRAREAEARLADLRERGREWEEGR